MEDMPMKISWKKNTFKRDRCWRRKHHDDDDQSQSFSQSLHLSLLKTSVADDDADNKALSMSKTTTTYYENDNKASSLDSDYSPHQHKWRRLGSNPFENYKPMKSKESREKEVKALAELALAQHNKDKSAHYEYVRSSGPINPAKSGSRCWGHAHMNFFAKLKGTDDASSELFFAVLNPWKEVVLHCCILDPKPYSDGDAHQEPRVHHCKDVECRHCAYIEKQRSANKMIFV